MNVRFDGKRALVTGGRGIGREIARSLVRCGAKTFVFTKSNTTVESLRLEDPDIQAMQVDIADWESTRKAVESILPLNLLVNNAGILRIAPFTDAKESDIGELFSVNYKAAFNISQTFARALTDTNAPGSIVNVSSIISLRCFPGGSVYASSKAALDSLTKNMASELGCKQIRVNEVSLTAFPTDMIKDFLEDTKSVNAMIAAIPLGRIGELREAADAVLFLLSDRASLVNGVTLPVDGGHVL